MNSALVRIGTIETEHSIVQLRGQLIRGTVREGMQTVIDHERITVDFVELEKELVTLTISTSGTMSWLETLVGKEVEFIEEGLTPAPSLQLGTESV